MSGSQWIWFFIVLSFIDMGNSYLCREDFCAEENAVCYNFQCLAECPPSTFVFEGNCVKSCPSGFFSDGKECTVKCPIDKPFIQDGHCLSQCTNGRVLNNGTCTIGCPNHSFLFNNSCEDACPKTHPLTLNKTVVAQGQKHKTVTKYVRACVNECPETTVRTTHSCLLNCPEKMILFNQSCVDICPSLHSIVLIRKTVLNSIPTCVAHCPPNYFRFGKTCVIDCPFNTLISNNTCVKNCTEPFPFLCAYGTCAYHLMWLKATNSRCLSKCPTNFVLVHKSCFRYCKQSPSPYRLNDTCVSECPNNLKVMNGLDKYCVKQCPEGFVEFNDQCLRACPLNTILVNGICYEQCPVMYPFRYKFHLSFSSNYRIKCVKSCPAGTFLYNNQCLEDCPRDFPAIQNRTCTKNCTDPFPLTCIRHTCSSANSDGKIQCLSECPPNHKQYEQECFRHCFYSPFKFLDNGTCVYECPKNLSFGLEKQCVDMCFENTYKNHDSCVYDCPKGTFPFNKVCYTSCPPEFPYKSEYTIGPPWDPFTRIDCHKLCPNGTLIHNLTCISKCPTDWLIFNSTCVMQCPSTHPYIYKIYMETRCVSEIPNNTLQMNGTFYSQCPDYAKYVLNGTCNSICPVDYPLSQPVALNYIITHQCVDTCKNNTLLWNQTCVSSCPSGLLIYKRSCVKSCPYDTPLIYFATRKFLLTPISPNPIEEMTSFCGRYCNRNYVFDNVSEPCIHKGTYEYHLLVKPCKPMEYSGSIQRIVQNCIKKSLFERNGTFYEKCPKSFKQTRRNCVDECPFDEPFFEPKTRRCITKCSKKHLKYKQLCLEKCPSNYFIVNSICRKKCPINTPVYINRNGGKYCYKNCPDGYFLDGNVCVKKCTGKKILGKTCAIKCTETHPFIKIGFSHDIPECLQECPENYLGNVTSFKCIHEYDCHDFVFNKRCYPKCPNYSITVINGQSKKCYSSPVLLIQLISFFLIATIPLLLCILYMCVERSTPTRCLQRLKTSIDKRNQRKKGEKCGLFFQFNVANEDQIRTYVSVESKIDKDPEESSKVQCTNADDGVSQSHYTQTFMQRDIKVIKDPSPTLENATEMKVIIHDDSIGVKIP